MHALKHYKAIGFSVKHIPIRSRKIKVWMSRRRPLEWHASMVASAGESCETDWDLAATQFTKTVSHTIL